MALPAGAAYNKPHAARAPDAIRCVSLHRARMRARLHFALRCIRAKLLQGLWFEFRKPLLAPFALAPLAVLEGVCVSMFECVCVCVWLYPFVSV